MRPLPLALAPVAERLPAISWGRGPPDLTRSQVGSQNKTHQSCCAGTARGLTCLGQNELLVSNPDVVPGRAVVAAEVPVRHGGYLEPQRD